MLGQDEMRAKDAEESHDPVVSEVFNQTADRDPRLAGRAESGRRHTAILGRWPSFLITLCLGALLWSGTLRTDAAPYGDGSRILKWLGTIAHSGETFPTWNPFRNGGYPLFADPEQFWILVPFIDPGSASANLQLNLALFVALLVPLALAWCVSRRLELDGRWAVVAAVLVGVNELMIVTEQSARFAGFINFSSLLGMLAVLARRRLDLLSYALLVLCVGAAIVVAVQYALLQGAFLYSVFLFGPQADWSRPLRHLLWATFRAAGVCLAGTALAGVVLLPLFGHLSEAYGYLGSVQYEPLLPDRPSELLRLIVPYVPTMHPMLLPLLVVPAIVLAAAFGVPYRLQAWARGVTLPAAIAAVFLLMCLPLVGPIVQAAYASLPLISSIRQFGTAQLILVVLTSFAAVLLFQHHGSRRLAELGRPARLALGGYCLAAAAGTLAFGIVGTPVFSALAAGAAAVLLLSAAGYLLATSCGWQGMQRAEAGTMAVVGIGLAIVTLLVTAPMAFLERHPEHGRRLHVDNRPELPRLFQVVETDGQAYFRFFRDVGSVWFLHAQERGDAAFSLHYPRSQAYTFAYLSEAFDPDAQRPHWVKTVHCSKFDPRALSLLAVKYLFCREARLDGYQPPGFVPIGTEDGMILFRRADPDAARLRVFCRWREAPGGAPRQVREEVLSAFAHGEALLDKEFAGFPRDPACPKGGPAEAAVTVVQDSADEMVLTAETAQAGILVIPDNWAPGWSATVNGEGRPIVRAFHAYRGIPVERGRSEIRLLYRDRYLAAGFVLSGVTSAVLGFAIALGLLLRLRGRLRGRTSRGTR